MITRYDILVTHDAESGLFLTEVPDLPGCFSQGETEQQATANVREVIAVHVQTLRDLGREVPQSSTHVLRAVDVAIT